jgi:MOSC domain-containing protein YiiM
MSGELVQLNISPGGMPKTPILAARVTVDGVPGDWQKNRKYHGGPNRAICLFSVELYEQLKEEGMPMALGSVGENFTIRGIDLNALQKGDRLRVGGCTIEITDVRTPCGNLKKWYADLHQAMKGRSGWVCKVVEEGDVKPGDAIERV